MARPEKKEDRPVLINMAESWVNSGCSTPVRQLAVYYGRELLPAGFTDESFNAADQSGRSVKQKMATGRESTSRRLQRKFRRMVKDGTALKVGTYKELHAARHRYRKNAGGGLAPQVPAESDLAEGSPDRDALSAVANALSLTADEVINLAKEGHAILDVWQLEEQETILNKP